MCRIAVLIRPHLLVEEFGLERVGRGLVEAMKTLANDGNTDACGIAVMKNDGRMAWVKVPMSCKNVARHIHRHRRTLYPELLEDTLYLLLHARKATRGDPSYIPNNHPFCLDSMRMCLIHNGSVERTCTVKTSGEVKAMEELEWPETDSARLVTALAVELLENPDMDLYEAARRAWRCFRGKASVAVFRGKELLYTVNWRATIYYGFYKDFEVLATSNETIEALADAIGLKRVKLYFERDVRRDLDALQYWYVGGEATIYIDAESGKSVVREVTLIETGYSHNNVKTLYTS